jgi:hypothetical protein
MTPKMDDAGGLPVPIEQNLRGDTLTWDSIPQGGLMAVSGTTTPSTSDVLHFEGHSRLSAEEIAKAVARHQREHPNIRMMNAAAKSQKTIPRQ